MEELKQIVWLLGEENEQKIKNAITEMIIDNMQQNIDDMSVWLIDFETMFDEIREEIKDDIKKKVVNKYLDAVSKKVDEFIDKI